MRYLILVPVPLLAAITGVSFLVAALGLFWGGVLLQGWTAAGLRA
jgi:hypothetical protein